MLSIATKLLLDFDKVLAPVSPGGFLSIGFCRPLVDRCRYFCCCECLRLSRGSTSHAEAKKRLEWAKNLKFLLLIVFLHAFNLNLLVYSCNLVIFYLNNKWSFILDINFRCKNKMNNEYKKLKSLANKHYKYFFRIFSHFQNLIPLKNHQCFMKFVIRTFVMVLWWES